MKRIKKKYNPFKMWGSYVGGILFFLIIPITIYGFGGGATMEIWRFEGFGFNQISIILSVIWFSIGFLIGWGIHSLIRRFSK